jgi:ABC-type bacteriocin/lantibiotic exporter with double-glycine peptidase domain
VISEPVVKVQPQRHPADCSVAVLAMTLAVSYEDALVAFRHDVKRHGATMRQIQGAARRLGRVLRHRKTVDLDEDQGILAVEWRKQRGRLHVVVLRAGQIVDTDETIWDADVYVSVVGARIAWLLEVQP